MYNVHAQVLTRRSPVALIILETQFCSLRNIAFNIDRQIHAELMCQTTKCFLMCNVESPDSSR